MKQVRCICNKDMECYLTVGRIYNVLYDSNFGYRLKDTVTGEEDSYFFKERFEII